MVRLELRAAIAVVCSVSVWVCGCTTSSSPPPVKSGAATNTAGKTEGSGTATTNGKGTESTTATTPGRDAESIGKATVAAKPGHWEDYPDVPKYEIMSEVNGIKIPRWYQLCAGSTSALPLKGRRLMTSFVSNISGKRR